MLNRIARWTVNSITALHLLLSIVSIYLWSRSQSRCEFFWTTRLPTTLYFFHEDGRFRLGVWKNNDPDLKEAVKEAYFHVPYNDPRGRSFLISTSDIGMPYWFSTLILASLPGIRLARHSSRQ